MKRMWVGVIGFVTITLASCSRRAAEEPERPRGPARGGALSLKVPGSRPLKGGDLGPFLATPRETAEAMLKLAGVTKDDVVYDLGCGDGAIVVVAAKTFGARAVGIEIDPDVAKMARDAVQLEQLAERVTITEGDAAAADLSQATVVALYLTPEGNLKLKPILQKALKPGTRIVSHNSDMGDWAAEKQLEVVDDRGIERTLYLWRIAAAKAE